MPDVQQIGGVTGWLRAAALAQAAGVPCSSHLFIEASAHLLAVTPTCHWIEYLDMAGPIMAEPLRPVDGTLHAPPGPGSGSRGTRPPSGATSYPDAGARKRRPCAPPLLRQHHQAVGQGPARAGRSERPVKRAEPAVERAGGPPQRGRCKTVDGRNWYAVESPAPDQHETGIAEQPVDPDRVKSLRGG